MKGLQAHRRKFASSNVNPLYGGIEAGGSLQEMGSLSFSQEEVEFEMGQNF